MKPNFIIGGTMKSGTTFMHNLLRNHNNIKIIDRKMEYAFFDDDRIYPKGINWYKSLFNSFSKFQKNGYMVGQTSADCAYNKGSLERIKEHIPDVKLLFVLRHPVERAYSHYWFMYANIAEVKKIETAFFEEKSRILENYHNYKFYSYVERSRYSDQFKNIYEHFNEEQILLVPFENLVKSTLETINKVCDFLEVSKVDNLEELNIEKTKKNKAKLPSNHFVVQLSFYLSKLGLRSVGKRLTNMFRVEKSKPPLEPQLRSWLESELKEDIEFYENMVKKFNSK